MKKESILFDLDGTITDSKEGILKGIQYALKSFGIPSDCLDDLCPFIGPPIRDTFQEAYGFTEAEAEKGCAVFREYFSEKGIYENALYPGMDILLRRLNQCGKKVILATSKPTIYAERILEHFKIRDCFAFVAGSELDGRRAKKEDVMQYAVEQMKLDVNHSVMVGDRAFDIFGARQVGMESVGVLYGYGSFQELTDAKATYIAERVDRLFSLLLEEEIESYS